MCKNKKNAHDEELDDAHTLAISKKVFYITTMTDLENLQTTVQLRRMREYQYTMPTPDMHWILESGDTLISGVSCKRQPAIMPADIILHGMMKTSLSHTGRTFSMGFQG